MTPETINRLTDGFILGLNDTEVCRYADISKSAYYAYLEKYPEFKEKRDILRSDTTLQAKIKAREAILNGDEIMIRWYLERRAKEEFSLTHNLEISAEGSLTIEDKQKALREMLENFKTPGDAP